MKETILRVLLIFGIFLFVFPILLGISSASNGEMFLCFGSGCEKEYGVDAFFDTLLLYSVILWPTYILG